MKQHLDELWGRIEQLTEELKDDPDNRMLAVLLSAAVDNYNAKLKIYIQDNESQKETKPRRYEG